MLKILGAGHYQLSLIFYTAPSPINWENPGDLVKSFLKNYLVSWISSDKLIDSNTPGWLHKVTGRVRHPSPISHVDVMLSDDKGNYLLRGMARKRTNKSVMKMLNGGGLEHLIENYPGYLMENHHIEPGLRLLIPKGEVRWLNLKIGEKLYHYLLDYLNGYVERNYHSIYAGFQADPLKGEGAGCAHFAYSFLRVMGIEMDSFEKSWKRILRVPQNYLKTHTDKPEFNLWKLLLKGHHGKWAQEHEPHVAIEVIDPQLMYDWVYEIYHSKNHHRFSDRVAFEKGVGVTLDASDVIPKSASFWIKFNKTSF